MKVYKTKEYRIMSVTSGKLLTANEDQLITVEAADEQKAQNWKFFPEEKIAMIKSKLDTLDEDRFLMVTSLDLKDPTTMLIISIVGGSLGIDRFMLGDTAMGVLKLLTGGVCGILTIVDWFSVQRKAKELNFNKLMLVL